MVLLLFLWYTKTVILILLLEASLPYFLTDNIFKGRNLLFIVYFL